MLLLGQRNKLLSQPTWGWSFRDRLSTPPGASFTRASAGWSFNSSGVLTQASTNVARFDYDPATLQPLGYLSEIQSTNAVVRSQALTGASWAASSLTVTDNAQTSPDGTADASTLVVPAATSAHTLLDATSFSATLNSVYGFSFFAKNISGSLWLQFSIAGSFFANFNPATGTIGSSSTNVSSLNARQLANGWWRFSGFYTADATATKSFGVAPVPAINSAYRLSFTGDASSTVAVFGVQIETAGVGVTSYIPTAGSTVTRAADILSLPLTSLPGWSPIKGGVLVATYRLYTVAHTATVAMIQDGGAGTNAVVMYENFSNAGFARFSIIAAGNLVQLGGAASPAPFVRRRMAAGWNVGRQQVAHDGTLDNTNSGQSSALPASLVNLRIGTDDGTNGVNGAIESIAYYASARSDAFVQQVSR